MNSESNLVAHPGDKDVGAGALMKKASSAAKMVKKDAYVHTQQLQERSVHGHQHQFTTNPIISANKHKPHRCVGQLNHLSPIRPLILVGATPDSEDCSLTTGTHSNCEYSKINK